MATVLPSFGGSRPGPLDSDGPPISTMMGCSSGPGSSRVANWLSSSAGGMKWPLRAFIRSAISAFEPRRYISTVSGRVPIRMSRYDRFNAEQATTADWPAASSSSSRAAMARSQGQRSSSVSGVPAFILAMLAGGWKESPSSRIQPSARARPAAMVVLPLPDTPMTTTIVISWSARHGRRSRSAWRTALFPRRCAAGGSGSG